jgi:hypothetical protein
LVDQPSDLFGKSCWKGARMAEQDAVDRIGEARQPTQMSVAAQFSRVDGAASCLCRWFA